MKTELCYRGQDHPAAPGKDGPSFEIQWNALAMASAADKFKTGSCVPKHPKTLTESAVAAVQYLPASYGVSVMVEQSG